MEKIQTLSRRLSATPEHAASCAERSGLRVRGFTLLEILVAMAILGALLAIAIPAFTQYVENARVAKAATEIRALENEVKLYETENSLLPDNLNDIGRGGLLDPWGSPYAYLKIQGGKNPGAARKDRFLVPLNSDFDLYSIGKDKQSQPPLTAKTSLDDIVRANDGGYVGLASNF